MPVLLALVFSEAVAGLNVEPMTSEYQPADNMCIVVSDAHLGAVPAAAERTFHDFLVWSADHTRDLIINGDLFDFWFEYRTVIMRRHFRTLRLLADLVDSGMRIRYMGGNHDFWAGSFLRDEIGIELLDGPQVTAVGGRRTFLAHGDGLGSGDHGYKALKRIIRSAPAVHGFRFLHPDYSARLIDVISRTERKHLLNRTSPDEPSVGILEAFARRLLNDDESLQLVLLGHSHYPDLIEIGEDRHYLNAGDWMTEFTWGEVSPDGVTLNRWNPR